MAVVAACGWKGSAASVPETGGGGALSFLQTVNGSQVPANGTTNEMEVLLESWFHEGQTIVSSFLVAFVAVILAAFFGRFLAAPDENAVPFPDGLVGGTPTWRWLRNSYVRTNEEDRKSVV